MPTKPPRLQSAFEVVARASPAVEPDEIDLELLALRAAPRRNRTLTLVILLSGALAASAMVVALRHDVAYAFWGTAHSGPTGIGDLRAVTDEALRASDNAYVSGEGLLGAAGGLRYERPFRDETFRALPVAGRTDLWVEVRVPPAMESGRWEPPRVFTGRLERFDAAGPSHRGLRSAIEEATRARVPRGAFLLVDGEDPDHARWAVVLAATFLVFAMWNAASIARLVRRVR